MTRYLYFIVFFLLVISFSSVLYAKNFQPAPPCTVLPISGPSSVCAGGSITLTDATTGGTWSSSTTSVANIGSSSGHVTPVSAGTTTITYTVSPGCIATYTITVGIAPAAISAPSDLCIGSVATLTDPTPGGTWISSNTSAVTVGSTSGIATASGIGTATISYIVGGCSTSTNILVNVSVPPIGVPGTPLCPGSNMTLSESLPGGTYSTSNPAVALVSSLGGVVTGVSGGVVTITYTLATYCYNTASVTINPAPAPISGGTHVCLGSTLALSDVLPGGTWSSTNLSVATISGTGLVTGVSGGYDTILYTLPTTGCSAYMGLNVINLPAISGWDSVCAWGDTTTLTDSYPGGIFTSTLVTVTNMGGGTGLLTPEGPGMATVTYTIPMGCNVTKIITVNALPGLITGTYQVCAGFTSMLADVTPGGTWSSGSPLLATIGAGTGLVTGLATGPVEIFYTLPNGCRRDTLITVIAPPAPIGGPANICAGAVTVYTDSSSGGTWSSSYPPDATINAVTGSLMAYVASTVTITYAVSSSCSVSKTITINPLPAIYSITGGGSYCAGGSGAGISLSGSETGVNYQLYNGTTPVDTVMHGTGGIINFGLLTGSGTYSIKAVNVTTGCTSNMGGTTVITANPLPTSFAVTGGGAICAGGAGVHIGLASSTPGVNYQLYVGGVATGSSVPGIGAAIDFGPHTTIGTYTVVATNSITGCSATMTGSAITSIATPVTPSVSIHSSWGDTICSGVVVLYSAAPVNGGSLPTFLWRVNGATMSTSTTYSYNPMNGDNVTVTMTSNAVCANPDTASDGMVMVVNPTLIPLVTITAAPGTAIAHGQNVSFTATVTSGGSAPTYQWSVNGIPVAGATLPVYSSSILNNGDIVTCTVTSSGNCGGHTGQNSVTMNVNTTGIKVLHSMEAAINIVPNPNKGEFSIIGNMTSSVAGEENVTLQINNLLGQMVYGGILKMNNGVLNEHVSLSGNIAGGVYLVSVQSGSEKLVFHMVIE